MEFRNGSYGQFNYFSKWIGEYLELEVIIRTNREAGLERRDGALAGVAQWNVHWPANQRVVGLILSQGTCLGCGPGPQ